MWHTWVENPHWKPECSLRLKQSRRRSLCRLRWICILNGLFKMVFWHRSPESSLGVVTRAVLLIHRSLFSSYGLKSAPPSASRTLYFILWSAKAKFVAHYVVVFSKHGERCVLLYCWNTEAHQYRWEPAWNDHTRASSEESSGFIIVQLVKGLQFFWFTVFYAQCTCGSIKSTILQRNSLS